MRIYNSMTGKKEEFIPMDEKNVKMYACGITVYDDCHIGHARQAIVYEIMSQYLRYKGYNVTYVRNYTDVDDKIIARSNQEGVNALDYSTKKIKEAEEDLAKLDIKDADIKPKASENIQNIIEFVSKLIEKGHAYPTEKGDVYFSVRSFPEYGKLSKRNPDDMISGVRKDVEEGKRDPLDFALWKSAKEGEISWKSPWGEGRPGWHIECSVMSMNNLGESIDIHGGGKDLIFPHHENEIAQSEALTGKNFVNYWTHNGLIKVNGQKMSKSLGNTLTIKEVTNKYNSEVIRYAMILKHYSTDLDLSDKEFALTEKQLYYFYNTLENISQYINKSNVENTEEKYDNDISQEIETNFVEAMDDDFNTSAAIAQLFKICKKANIMLKNNKIPEVEKVNILSRTILNIKRVYSILGLMQQEPSEYIEDIKQKYLSKLQIDRSEIESLVEERTVAKGNKDYSKADEIRDSLDSKGIILNDSKEGTTWDIKEIYNFVPEEN